MNRPCVVASPALTNGDFCRIIKSTLTIYDELTNTDSSSSFTFPEGVEIVLAYVIRDFMRLMKRHGLSTPQIHALMYIHHAGSCQVSDIGALANVSTAAASQLVERLVQQALVERREDPDNRRTKILRLSAKGKRLIRETLSSNHFLRRVIASLSEEQRQTVRAAFATLAQTLQRMHESEEE